MTTEVIELPAGMEERLNRFSEKISQFWRDDPEEMVKFALWVQAERLKAAYIEEHVDSLSHKKHVREAEVATWAAEELVRRGWGYEDIRDSLKVKDSWMSHRLAGTNRGGRWCEDRYRTVTKN